MGVCEGVNVLPQGAQYKPFRTPPSTSELQPDVDQCATVGTNVSGSWQPLAGTHVIQGSWYIGEEGPAKARIRVELLSNLGVFLVVHSAAGSAFAVPIS